MFGSVKTKIALAAELIMPWLVMVCGIPAIYWWGRLNEEWKTEHYSQAYYHASDLCSAFYYGAMVTGVLIMLAEGVIAMVSFVFMLKALKNKEKCVTYTMVVLIVGSIICSIGTAFLMLIVLIFTYGQGV